MGRGRCALSETRGGSSRTSSRGRFVGKDAQTADLLQEPGKHVIPHAAFPQAHWWKTHATRVLCTVR